jgi:hypothetical protein
MALPVDTGILYALADADDDWHARARKLFEDRQQALIAPVTVIPEVCYLLHQRLGARAEMQFVQAVADGEVVAQDLTSADWDRLLEVMGDYPDLGFVDASLVSVAKRLKVTSLATPDRRHIGKVRSRHVRAFRLRPCATIGLRLATSGSAITPTR